MKPVPSLLSPLGAQFLVLVVISIFSAQLSLGVRVVSSSQQGVVEETDGYGASASPLRNVTGILNLNHFKLLFSCGSLQMRI